MCRESIAPAFDITPEMITHTVVVDPDTCQPVEPQIWEQYDWQALPVDEPERIQRYIASACRILDNVGLTPEGVTSPGGFGGQTLDFYARMAGLGIRQVTDNPTPYFFQRISAEGSVESPAWHVDREAGTAVGEIVACTGDWTGSWTGYGEVNVDRYITADLQGGRLPEVIRAGDPTVLCSHWQGFYGLHNDDRRGFRALKTVVRRLKALDPHGEHTRWRKVSEITNYACARAMAEVSVAANGAIHLDLPARVPEFTLRLEHAAARAVFVDDAPLRQASARVDFRSGTFLVEGQRTLVAFDPPSRHSVIRVVGSQLT
jgi:hypothetical protein